MSRRKNFLRLEQLLSSQAAIAIHRFPALNCNIERMASIKITLTSQNDITFNKDTLETSPGLVVNVEDSDPSHKLRSWVRNPMSQKNYKERDHSMIEMYKKRIKAAAPKNQRYILNHTSMAVF